MEKKEKLTVQTKKEKEKKEQWEHCITSYKEPKDFGGNKRTQYSWKSRE